MISIHAPREGSDSFTPEQRLLNAQELVNTARGVGQKWVDALAELLQLRAQFVWQHPERYADAEARLANGDQLIKLLTDNQKGLNLDELANPADPHAQNIGEWLTQWYAERGLQFPRPVQRRAGSQAQRIEQIAESRGVARGRTGVATGAGEAVGRVERAGAAAGETGAASTVGEKETPSEIQQVGYNVEEEGGYGQTLEQRIDTLPGEWEGSPPGPEDTGGIRGAGSEGTGENSSIFGGAGNQPSGRAARDDQWLYRYRERAAAGRLYSPNRIADLPSELREELHFAANALPEHSFEFLTRENPPFFHLNNDFIATLPEKEQSLLRRAQAAVFGGTTIGLRTIVGFNANVLEHELAHVASRYLDPEDFAQASQRVLADGEKLYNHIQAELRAGRGSPTALDVLKRIQNETDEVLSSPQWQEKIVNRLKYPFIPLGEEAVKAGILSERSVPGVFLDVLGREIPINRAGRLHQFPLNFEREVIAYLAVADPELAGAVFGKALERLQTARGPGTHGIDLVLGEFQDVAARLTSPEAIADPTIKGDLEAALADKLLEILEPLVIQEAGNFGGRALPRYLDHAIEQYIKQIEPLQREAKQAANAVGRWYQAHTVLFQSTLPVKGATWDGNPLRPVCQVSIHAPREGSDRMRWANARSHDCFNPRSP